MRAGAGTLKRRPARPIREDLTMGVTTPTHAWTEARSPEPGYRAIRVYVWEFPVRLSHWVTVVTAAVLCFTGYYMHNPFIISRGSGAYLMGTMRYIHLLTAFVF